jgi:ATP-dependent DNA helicase RecQ
MFSPGDRVKQMRFIDEKPSPQERELARAQLEQMIHYAEIASCRREFLLGYFGEKFGVPPSGGSLGAVPPEDGTPNAFNCEGCDNCLAPRQTWDGTLAAQKFLSCVYRIREKSGFGVGLQHVVEVLCGADTEKVRKFGHHTLSTYGIGTEHTRAEWGSIGRELVRHGLLFQNTEKFSIIELTDSGRAALKARQKITLTRPVAPTEPAKHRVGEIACDEVLFDKLRALRKRLADERGVPPYIVFSDVALRQMARHYPASEKEFSRISGVGEKKLREFGATFLGEVSDFLKNNPRQIFADDSFAEPAAPAARSRLNDTARETLHFFRQGKTVDEIARLRGLKESTIYGHLEDAMRAGERVELDAVLDAQAQRDIAAAFERYGFGNLTGATELLGGRYSSGQLRVYRAAAQAGGAR